MKLNDFKLEVFFGEYEFSAPYLLTQSDCETVTIKELLDMEEGAEAAFLSSGLGYLEVEGTIELREQIAGLYDDLGLEHILVHSGAQEVIFNLMNVLLEEGDHVISQFPIYQSLYSVAEAIGAEVDLWKVLPTEDSWRMDLAELKAMIRPTTKLLIINTPNNPTGFTFSKEELVELSQLAKDHGIRIICDEVYSGLEHDGMPRPRMADLDPSAVSIGVMSKAYGLAGLRIGWMATKDLELIDRLIRMKHYTTICSAGPSEFLATIALKHGDRLLARSRELITQNMQLAEDFFSKFPDHFLFRRPMAGPIGYVEYLGKEGVVRFTQQAVKEKGVLLLPATMYDDDSEYFRMGFGRADFSEGLKQLEAFVQSLE